MADDGQFLGMAGLTAPLAGSGRRENPGQLLRRIGDLNPGLANPAASGTAGTCDSSRSKCAVWRTYQPFGSCQ